MSERKDKYPADVGGQTHEQLDGEWAANYRVYASRVAELQTAINEIVSVAAQGRPRSLLTPQELDGFKRQFKRIPGYVGQGDEAVVFSGEAGSERVVIKMYLAKDRRAFNTEAEYRARGIERAEQLRAWSPVERIKIFSFLPGREIDTALRDRRVLKDSHIEGLVETHCQLHDKKLGVDPHAGNYLFDPSVGFSIVDYKEQENVHAYNWDHELMRLFDIIYPVRLWLKESKGANERRAIIRFLVTMKRFLTVMKEKFPVLHAQMLKGADGSDESYITRLLYEPQIEPQERERFVKEFRDLGLHIGKNA